MEITVTYWYDREGKTSINNTFRVMSEYLYFIGKVEHDFMGSVSIGITPPSKVHNKSNFVVVSTFFFRLLTSLVSSDAYRNAREHQLEKLVESAIEELPVNVVKLTIIDVDKEHNVSVRDINYTVTDGGKLRRDNFGLTA